MVYVAHGADWWRDRQWRCRGWFMLREPYRVIDIRGAIMQAVFRCPVCGRRNDATRLSLDKIEPPQPRSRYDRTR